MVMGNQKRQKTAWTAQQRDHTNVSLTKPEGLQRSYAKHFPLTNNSNTNSDYDDRSFLVMHAYVYSPASMLLKWIIPRRNINLKFTEMEKETCHKCKKYYRFSIVMLTRPVFEESVTVTWALCQTFCWFPETKKVVSCRVLESLPRWVYNFRLPMEAPYMWYQKLTQTVPVYCKSGVVILEIARPEWE